MNQEEREQKGSGGRPREISLVRNADGSLSSRLWLDVEGEHVRRMVHLGTTDRQVALKRAQRISSGEDEAAVVKKGTTFREVAERVMAESPIRTSKERLSRLERYAYPLIGELHPGDIKVRDIKACFGAMEDALGWTRSIKLLKGDLSYVLGTLYSEQEIAENVCERIDWSKLKPIRAVTALRVVLTDDEFSRLLAYGITLIDDGALPELYMLCLSARCLGGMRTSDLHAWRWEHIDIEQWFDARVPRPKTMGGTELFQRKGGGDGDDSFVLEPYELPSEFAGFLYAWWQAAGSPTEGPVFPVRRGPRAGEHKKPRISYAEALRDALWAAGVVRPEPGFALARPEDRRQHCSLQSGIAGRRACVDFHSFRRAFVQGVIEAGLPLGESMRLADHWDPATHVKYQRIAGEKHRVTPGTALPKLPKLPASAPRPKAPRLPPGEPS